MERKEKKNKKVISYQWCQLVVYVYQIFMLDSSALQSWKVFSAGKFGNSFIGGSI